MEQAKIDHGDDDYEYQNQVQFLLDLSYQIIAEIIEEREERKIQDSQSYEELNQDATHSNQPPSQPHSSNHQDNSSSPDSPPPPPDIGIPQRPIQNDIIENQNDQAQQGQNQGEQIQMSHDENIEQKDNQGEDKYQIMQNELQGEYVDQNNEKVLEINNQEKQTEQRRKQFVQEGQKEIDQNNQQLKEIKQSDVLEKQQQSESIQQIQVSRQRDKYDDDGKLIKQRVQQEQKVQLERQKKQKEFQGQKDNSYQGPYEQIKKKDDSSSSSQQQQNFIIIEINRSKKNKNKGREEFQKTHEIHEQIVSRINERLTESILYEKTQKIKELNLSQINIIGFNDYLKFHIQKINTLQVISLSNCGIQSLQYFPKLPRLIGLDLANNKITDSANFWILHTLYPKLEILLLQNNNIKSLTTIDKLVDNQYITELDFSGNKIRKSRGYKMKIMANFLKIVLLDGKQLLSDQQQHSQHKKKQRKTKYKKQESKSEEQKVGNLGRKRRKRVKETRQKQQNRDSKKSVSRKKCNKKKQSPVPQQNLDNGQKDQNQIQIIARKLIDQKQLANQESEQSKEEVRGQQQQQKASQIIQILIPPPKKRTKVMMTNFLVDNQAIKNDKVIKRLNKNLDQIKAQKIIQNQGKRVQHQGTRNIRQQKVMIIKDNKQYQFSNENSQISIKQISSSSENEEQDCSQFEEPVPLKKSSKRQRKNQKKLSKAKKLKFKNLPKSQIKASLRKMLQKRKVDSL